MNTVGRRVAIGLLAGSLLLAGTADAKRPPAAITSRPLLVQQETTVLQQLLSYPSTGQAQVSSAVLTVPPGASTGFHRHDAPLYAYVMEGTLTVDYDGGVTKTYTAGSAIMEAVGTRHNGHNDTKKNVVLLVVNIGAAGVANSVAMP